MKFCIKWKFLHQMEIFASNGSFAKKRGKILQNMEILRKMEILQKWKFSSKSNYFPP